MLLIRALYTLLSSRMPRRGTKRRKTRYFLFLSREIVGDSLALTACSWPRKSLSTQPHPEKHPLVIIRTHVKAPPEGANTEESTYKPPKSFIVRHGRVGPEVLS